MPAPASVPELLDLIQKSGVADEGKVKAYTSKLADQGELPTDPTTFAKQLVRDGLLTFFQAEQLLQGKWKRFSIGKYKVLERLGAGGMGQVFLCEHKLMRRRVAVKVLPTAKAEDKASLERFYREARAVAAVDHPNIVRAYDIDQEDNLHFLVMEFVDGTNLHDLIKKFGPLDVTRSCHYMYGSAVGLEHASEMGLVHRDIKPGNILIDRSGVVKILDMGLARFFHDETDAITRQYDENVLGTADYLSPEQALDSHTVDIRADIYSLGATFYYLLTGSAPFPEGSVAQKLIWHQNREPKPIQSIRPDVPEEVVAIVTKMMAKKPDDRFQTPGELMAALSPWIATPIAPPEEREMPQFSIAATGVPGSGMPSRVGTGSGPALAQRPIAGIHTPGSHQNPATPGNWAGARTTTNASTITPNPSLASGDAVWESLDNETQSVAQVETAKAPPSTPKSDRYTPGVRTDAGKRSRKPLLLVVGLLFVVGGAVGAYFAFFNKPTEPVPEPQSGGRRLLVTKAGGEGTYTTIALALRQAVPGDTIVIADERHSESMIRLFKGREPIKDVTIESGLAGGKPAVIELASAADTILYLSNADNVRIRNLELDGKGLVESAVWVSGLAPGVTFENVTIRGMKRSGFRFQSVAGEPDRPLLLDRCRLVLAPNTDGISIGGEVETRRVHIRACRIEGPGKAGVRLDGPMMDVEVSGNRFFKLEAGVSIAKLNTGKPLKAQITGNTFCEVSEGLAFEFEPKDQKAKLELLVARNFFAKSPNALHVEGQGAKLPGVTFQDNGLGKDAGKGNLPDTIERVQGSDLPPIDPADDGSFLLFPAGSSPTVGGNKVRVGAGN